MSKKIYAGNLPFSLEEEALRSLFSEFGAVDSVNIIIDRNTGRSKGFGFVEMADDDEAKKAIEELNGKDVSGRNIKVSEAKPQQPRRNSGFGSGAARSGNRW